MKTDAEREKLLPLLLSTKIPLLKSTRQFYDSPVLNEINMLFWWIFWRLFIKLKTGIQVF